MLFEINTSCVLIHAHGKSHLNETSSPSINYMQYGGGYSVQRMHIINIKVEDIQYRCVTPSIWRRCIISTVEGMQYGSFISIQRRVCSKRLPKLLKG